MKKHIAASTIPRLIENRNLLTWSELVRLIMKTYQMEFNQAVAMIRIALSQSIINEHIHQNDKYYKIN